jgi:hypothetical protein
LLPLLLLRPSNTSTGMAEMAADDSPSCSRPWSPQQQQQQVGQELFTPLDAVACLIAMSASVILLVT